MNSTGWPLTVAGTLFVILIVLFGVWIYESVSYCTQLEHKIHQTELELARTQLDLRHWQRLARHHAAVLDAIGFWPNEHESMTGETP